ncbi:MAG: hypothetical protein IJS82_05275 [Paludibacteraceae bacterium]|nr:hypothetical protein [Paludibacteraceae bacterium]
MMRKFLLIFICACAMVGCREYQVSDDSSLRLAFSHDTVRMDTVFTQQGSSTFTLKVYNRNASALVIDRIWLEGGKYFRLNVDGEQDLSRLTRVQINGGDSAFVFVRVTDFGALEADGVMLMEDLLHFHMANGVTQDVVLEAYGQNAVRIGYPGCGRKEFHQYHFTADKPYLLFDTVIIGGKTTIDAGARLYMHNKACIYALGDVVAKGTLDAPITICSDRLDRLFDSVPYRYAGGGWNGFFLQAKNPQQYTFEYVDILSGTVGLSCYSNCSTNLPKLTMNGCRIHNHTLYGLVLTNVDAEVSNTEISNCASYCVYCDGGTHLFAHTTIASYFGYTNIRVQTVAKEDASAVFINNLQKNAPHTISSFYNSIITGYLKNQLVVATPFDQYYEGAFVGNYLKTDTLALPQAHDNTYWQESDTAEVFRNTYYKYKEYIYYDFHLDSISPAKGIGDSIAALSYPIDREGVTRIGNKPDAGCYQSQQ